MTLNKGVIGEVIVIVNQKGGVSKTTTALSLWTGLSLLKGFKTLAIDLDPQCNLTISSGGVMDKNTAFDVLTGNFQAEESVQSTKLGDLIAGHKGLSGMEALLTQVGREYRLKNELSSLMETRKYDFIIIDTPPSLGILTVNALTACTSAIVPANADFFSMYGISQLGETLASVKKYTNPQLKTAGILLTRYTARTLLSRDMTANIEKLAELLGTKVFASKIRESVTVREAQLAQKSIFEYAPKSKVTQDYEEFINEIINDVNHDDTIREHSVSH